VRGENAQNIVVEHLKGRDHLGDLDADGKMLLKWILKKQGLEL
jgi:hypothetical protein